MSYCTHLSGCITIKGVTEGDLELLRHALASVVDTGKLCSPLARRLVGLDTKWRKAYCQVGRRVVEVWLRDYEINGDTIEGCAYMGGTRHNVVEQLNWILAWIKAEHPSVRFEGRIEWWDGECQGDSPDWFEIEGDEVKAYKTRIVKVEDNDADSRKMYELFRIEGSVEPVRGDLPHCGYDALISAARREHETHGDADLLLAAWIDDDGRVALSSFTTTELEAVGQPPK